MGCDIHMYVEVKGGGRDTWNLITRSMSIESSFREVRTFNVGWGEGRNYDVFAMLADVRNGYGFAGVDLGDGFKPISSPRGVPDDASFEYVDTVEKWGVDGHSHSYLSLRELLDLEHDGYWDRVTMKRGVVTRDEMTEIRDRGLVVAEKGNEIELSARPSSWAGGISGPDPADIFKLTWPEAYRTSAGWLTKTTIPLLVDLVENMAMWSFFREGVRGQENAPGLHLFSRGETAADFARPMEDLGERVRIVYFFDN